MTAPSVDADLAGLADVRAKARAAREALRRLEGADQETLDGYVRAMARAGAKAAEELARLAVDETGYGVYEHKIYKNRYNTGFVARWMLERRAVGVLWTDEASRVTAIGSPMGVIAGIIPVTNPTSTTGAGTDLRGRLRPRARPGCWSRSKLGRPALLCLASRLRG